MRFLEHVGSLFRFFAQSGSLCSRRFQSSEWTIDLFSKCFRLSWGSPASTKLDVDLKPFSDDGKNARENKPNTGKWSQKKILKCSTTTLVGVRSVVERDDYEENEGEKKAPPHKRLRVFHLPLMQAPPHEVALLRRPRGGVVVLRPVVADAGCGVVRVGYYMEYVFGASFGWIWGLVIA